MRTEASSWCFLCHCIWALAVTGFTSSSPSHTFIKLTCKMKNLVATLPAGTLLQNHGLLKARIMHLWYFQPKRWPALSVHTGMTVPRADSNWNISSVSVPILHYHIAGACKLSIFFLLSKILLFDCWAVTFSAASPVSRGFQRLELIFSINSNGC